MNFLKDKYALARIVGACGILGIMLIVGSFGLYIWGSYFANETVAPPKPCDLNTGSCTVPMSQGRSVTLEIDPKIILKNEPISVNVRLKNTSVEKVYLLVFAAEQKNISSKSIALVAKSPDIYSAKVIFPVIPGEEPSQWIMMVQIKKGQEVLSVPFRFTPVT